MSLYAGSTSQREQVKAIREHLSPEEKKTLARQSVCVGANFALILLPFSAVTVGTLVTGHLLASIGVLIIGWIVLMLALSLFQERYRKLLCSTVWAQSQGFKPEDLPMTFRALNKPS